MKKQKLDSKLNFKKSIVSNLQMNAIKGGASELNVCQTNYAASCGPCGQTPSGATRCCDQ